MSAFGRAVTANSIVAALFAGPGKASASKNFTAMSWIPARRQSR